MIIVIHVQNDVFQIGSRATYHPPLRHTYFIQTLQRKEMLETDQQQSHFLLVCQRNSGVTFTDSGRVLKYNKKAQLTQREARDSLGI